MLSLPVTFDAPNLVAIRSGRKTVVHRLATSPLAHCQPGDVLWVRESFGAFASAMGRNARLSKADYVLFRDGDYRWRHPKREKPERIRALSRAVWLPGTIMPHWACRLSLVVTSAALHRLQDVSRDDAIRHGCRPLPTSRGPFWVSLGPRPRIFASPEAAFRHHWQLTRLEVGERWIDNPDVVTIEFAMALP
ncbi:hypothetical protein [Sphingomonas abietis]|uniref:Chorismate lyase n=1 Tax=Sphingomonas abietis TaxID=3012344 RepID=A0ABY7NQI8_9SPHN|nr:hypothetical protein [Sphingomonas abietis]WBO23802.1 hypothetical protein PBT88_06685 [Sphingomonas abietis]